MFWIRPAWSSLEQGKKLQHFLLDRVTKFTYLCLEQGQGFVESAEPPYPNSCWVHPPGVFLLSSVVHLDFESGSKGRRFKQFKCINCTFNFSPSKNGWNRSTTKLPSPFSIKQAKKVKTETHNYYVHTTINRTPKHSPASPSNSKTEAGQGLVQGLRREIGRFVPSPTSLQPKMSLNDIN